MTKQSFDDFLKEYLEEEDNEDVRAEYNEQKEQLEKELQNESTKGI